MVDYDMTTLGIMTKNGFIMEERFWNRVKKTEWCWLWQGGKNSRGYGSFQVTTKTPKPAHRVAYELTKGMIPEGLTIDHLCGNKGCVNPEHLEVVTMSENHLRRKVR